MKNVCSFSEWIATCSQKPNMALRQLQNKNFENRKSAVPQGDERKFDSDSFEKHDKFQM